MRILIFGGTTESRRLSRRLADAGADITVSVVSEYGAGEQGEHPGVRIMVGPKDQPAMEAMMEGMDLVIDATHPYAAEASRNIRRAAEARGVFGIRLRRETDSRESSDRIVYAADRGEAARLAKKLAAGAECDAGGKGDSGRKGDTGGRILLTTGVRDLPFYASALDPRQLRVRVLPSWESIRTCEEAGVEHSSIIAIQGPFSAQLNEALIREYDIAVLVTKESGKSGGFAEKLEACRACGIPAVVIARPEEQGMVYEEVLEECLRRIGKEL